MAIFSAVKAAGILTRGATTDLLADADTLTVGSRTFRFKTTTAQADDIFLSGSSNAASIAALTSLVKIVNGTGTVAASGADAYTGTVQPHKEVKASGTGNLTVTFTARLPGTAGNHLPFSEVIADAQITCDAATLGTAVAGTGSAHADLGTWITATMASHQLNAQALRTFYQLQEELA